MQSRTNGVIIAVDIVASHTDTSHNHVGRSITNDAWRPEPPNTIFCISFICKCICSLLFRKSGIQSPSAFCVVVCRRKPICWIHCLVDGQQIQLIGSIISSFSPRSRSTHKGVIIHYICSFDRCLLFGSKSVIHKIFRTIVFLTYICLCPIPV